MMLFLGNYSFEKKTMSRPSIVHLNQTGPLSLCIGRAPTLLRSLWSRASLVMLAPAVLCHKEQLIASITPLGGILLAPRWFFMS